MRALKETVSAFTDDDTYRNDPRWDGQPSNAPPGVFFFLEVIVDKPNKILQDRPTTTNHIGVLDLLGGTFVPLWVMKMRGIDGDAKLMLAVLFSHCSPEGEATISKEDLAGALGVGLEKVTRVISKLRSKELIRVAQPAFERRRDKRGWDTYSFVFSPELEGETTHE